MIIQLGNFGGGGGGSVDPSVLSGYCNGGQYNASTQKIELLHDSNVIARIDASAFVIDGMVEDVYLSGTTLVIEFNTAAGKQNIEVPLSSIFDPSNYYTKTDVDAIASGKADTSALSAYTTNHDFALHSGNTDIHVTAQEKAAWNAKQDASAMTEYYTSAQTQSAISGAVLTKQDTLISGQNIKTINNESLLGSGNITISGGGSSNIVELTQAQYDALATKDPDTLYIITDAQAINMNDYWTSAQTSSAITQAVSGYQPITGMSAYTLQSNFETHSGNTSIHTTTAEKALWNGKQDALVSGTNIKTINNQSLLGSGNITISGGGSVTVDPSLNTGSTNPVANSAITNGFNEYTLRRNSENGEVRYFYVSSPAQPYGGGGQLFSNFSINGRCPLTRSNGTNDYIDKFSLVETSSITSAITSASTNSEVAGAKAVFDAIQAGGGGGSYVYYSEDTSVNTATIHIENTDDGTVGDLSVYGDGAQMAGSRNDSDEGIEYSTNISVGPENICITYDKGTSDINDTDAHSYLNVEENNISMEVSSDADHTTQFAVSNSAVTVNGENVVTENQLADYQPVLTAGTGIDITNNVISATGGGGATYSAGTNISIDTANTISCTLPITADSYNNITIGSGSSSSNQGYNVAIGNRATAGINGWYGTCIAIGTSASAPSSVSIAIGQQANANGGGGIAIGSQASTNITGGVAIGYTVNATGTTKMNLNNQITVDTNNQVYISNSANTSTYCVQQKIETTEAALGGLKFVRCTQAQYDAMVSGGTVDADTVYFIVSGS